MTDYINRLAIYSEENVTEKVMGSRNRTAWSDLGQFPGRRDRMRKGVGHNMHFTYCPHCGNKLIQK